MNPIFEAFNQHAVSYDDWFDAHENEYRLELAALMDLKHNISGVQVEVGCGSGRFAIPLGYDIGMDPSIEMLNIAKARGLSVIQAKGERLPFANDSVSAVLLVTTLCFTKHPERVLLESLRVLNQQGYLYLGFVPAESGLGISYQAKAKNHPLYKYAHFYTTKEVIQMCQTAGFIDFDFRQTLIPEHPSTVLNGFGSGGFVAMRVRKGIL